MDAVIALQVLTMGAVAINAWVSQKQRAEMAELEKRIIDRIEEKVGEYLPVDRFIDYRNSHAVEHRRIEQDLGKLLDQKKG